MNSEKITHTITLNPNDFLIPLENKLKEITNAVFFGMLAISEVDAFPESLYSNDSFYSYSTIGKLNFEQGKNNFKNWILKKGFEDFIIAITNLLIGFCFIIDKVEKETKFNNLTEYLDFLYEREDSNSKIFFPDLIRKISKYLKEPLLYEEEIKTLNKVRVCLVHRDGIVSTNDFNNVEKNKLILNWYKLVVYVKQEGIRRLLKYGDEVSIEAKFELTKVKREKLFTLNEKVEISFEEFNEIAIFCTYFAHDLLDKFYLPVRK